MRFMFIVEGMALGLLATGCGDWPWRHDMVDSQARSLAATSRPAIAGTIPVSADSTPVDNSAKPNQIAPAAAAAAGRSLYASYCSPCHGATGRGDGPVAQYFGSVRDLGDPAITERSDEWMYDVITNGIDRMPPSRHELTPHERWQIVRILRDMERPR